MLGRVLSYLKTLNFFQSPLTTTNEYELRNERISTRLFIFILLICTLIIFIYTAQVNITENLEVKNPSYDRFQSLSRLHSDTLNCPCDNAAIVYNSFVTLQPEFHQLCSSMLIRSQWIDYLASATGIYLSDDFSYIGSWFFRTLASFCQLANKTTANAIQTFESTQLTTAQALNEHVFNERMKTIMENFQRSTELIFYQSFDLIQISSQVNSLLSSLFSNMILSIDMMTYLITYQSRFYENNTCDCDETSTCIDPLTLLDRRINSNDSSLYFTIPGLFKGCFLVDAVRQSSLECFYQPSCISTIETFLQIPLPINSSILSLNSSLSSRFNISSTLNQLLSKAMTEIWQETLSHSQYFHQCHVSSCTYSTTARFNIIYMITTLISLLGGLTKILRIIIHPLVKFIRRRFNPLPEIHNSKFTFSLLIKRLQNFNYFSKPFSTSTKQDILATRLFFLILIVLFITLIIYYSAERVTFIHQIESPTFEQFNSLQADQQSNPTFSCPCSTLEISHGNLIEITYELHPYCSSNFIQLPRIDYPDSAYFTKLEFRLRASWLFDSLFIICQLASSYINNSLISFMASSIVTNEVLSKDIFTLEIHSIIDRFILSTKRSFARNLAVILNMTWSNAIMSGQATNFGFYAAYGINDSLVIQNSPYSYLNPNNLSDGCHCAVSMDCFYPMSIYSYADWRQDVVFTVPGFYMSCLQMKTMRFSSLICLFNQSCVNLISYWLNISDLKAIDMNNLKHFDVNSSLDYIANEIFVNQWNISISHRRFYEQCHPDRCTYKLIEHNSIWIIITIVFGLIGGLMKILQIIVPRFVQSIFIVQSRCCHRSSNIMTNTTQPFSFRDILHRVYQLNLFPSDNPSADNQHNIREQKISTRIFLLLLLLSLVVLTLYASQIQRTKTVIIKNPTMEQYSLLYKRYSQTLTCPCKNITIAQQMFIYLQPRFHQVCQSQFVDVQWREALFSTTNFVALLMNDFRLMSLSTFGTIASLCQLSRMTIDDGLFDFNASSFVSTKVIPEEQLINEGQSLINLFIATSQDAFVSTLQTVRDTTSVNVLMPGFETTTSVELRMINETVSQFVMVSQIYRSSCSCSNDPTCIEPAGIYNADSGRLLYAIPGIFVGCYMVEATLQSTLAFLYDQNQINIFRQMIRFDYFNPIPYNTSALNVSHDSQYNQSTPIYMMMEKMMTESWSKDINYSAYYQACHPVECKYTFIIKYDVIYIVTTITGLIGGLVTVYQVIIPIVIKFIFRCYFKRRHQRIIHIATVE